MRIVFIGAVRFSEACLKKLIAMHANVVGVCTLKESPFNADHVDLSPFCEEYRIPVSYMPDINTKESLDRIKSYMPDVIFCFGWSRLLKSELLGIAPLGVVGFHPAALPANRGRHPLIWALVLGLSETAATFFFMDEGADSGDILSQCRIGIGITDDAGDLYRKMTETALGQLEKFVPALASGCYQRIPQDHSEANVWRKRGKMDGKIDWRMSARSIHNLVRGLARPYVGAHFEINGEEISVWKTECVDDMPSNMEPGKILSADAFGVLVKAGEGAIRIMEMEPAITLEEGDYL